MCEVCEVIVDGVAGRIGGAQAGALHRRAAQRDIHRRTNRCVRIETDGRRRNGIRPSAIRRVAQLIPIRWQLASIGRHENLRRRVGQQ